VTTIYVHAANHHNHSSQSLPNQASRANAQAERKASVISVTLDSGALVPAELLDLANLPAVPHPQVDTLTLPKPLERALNEQYWGVDHRRQSTRHYVASHDFDWTLQCLVHADLETI